MSDVLALSSDFIERMSNPAYGVSVNEDYSIRFGKMLTSDGFDDMLQHEARRLRNVDTLSSHGWLWLLDWAKSRNISLDDELLLDLTERWSSVFMQVSVIDLATQNAEWTRRQSVATVEGFQNRWLSKLMQRSTTLPSEELSQADSLRQALPSSEYISTNRAENVLIALLQVGRDITVDAAATLLRHDWAGHTKLVRFFWSCYDGLDNETQLVWKSRLQPPGRLEDVGPFEAE